MLVIEELKMPRLAPLRSWKVVVRWEEWKRERGERWKVLWLRTGRKLEFTCSGTIGVNRLGTIAVNKRDNNNLNKTHSSWCAKLTAGWQSPSGRRDSTGRGRLEGDAIRAHSNLKITTAFCSSMQAKQPGEELRPNM